VLWVVFNPCCCGHGDRARVEDNPLHPNSTERFSLRGYPGWVDLPSRGRTGKPRATPWVSRRNRESTSPALKGRQKSCVTQGFCRPFRAGMILLDRSVDPRALPWTVLFAPFGVPITPSGSPLCRPCCRVRETRQSFTWQSDWCVSRTLPGSALDRFTQRFRTIPRPIPAARRLLESNGYVQRLPT
jgi:hypothetical protein